MAQTSIVSFFNKRKRSAIDELKSDRAPKLQKLNLDFEADQVNLKGVSHDKEPLKRTETVTGPILPNKVVRNPPSAKAKKAPVQKAVENDVTPKEVQSIFGKPQDVKRKLFCSSRMGDIQAAMEKYNSGAEKLKDIQKKKSQIEPPKEPERTPPSTPPNLNELKRKLLQSSRLSELKNAMSRFSEPTAKLNEAEKATERLLLSPKLKNFKSIEFEVQVSPQKSPEKPYLSPKKDAGGVRRNLLCLLSPTKNAVALPESPSKQILERTSKPALPLPVRYRFLAEIFRAIDTISQIMHNRNETITFRKLKPAVEAMMKRNLKEEHLAQIMTINPEAFELSQKKLRVFGAGVRKEQWELVLSPKDDKMSSDTLLERRKDFSKALLEKVKDYHDEFLKSLEPPINIPKDSITRWHLEFDLEKVPDIEASELPQPPVEETFTSGKDVLEKAREMFNCNTKMEKALAKLKAAKPETAVEGKPAAPTSILKGIPQALLEKVRQKQAAKALVTMTRSEDKEKELVVYSRLPEIARFARNLFVSEKKGVLPLDTVLDKLGNSYRTFLTKDEMERHLRLISEKVPNWLTFLTIRNCVYVKLAKYQDLSLVVSRLESLVKAKSENC